MLLFAASPGSTGGSSSYCSFPGECSVFRGPVFKGRSLGLCLPGCLYFYLGAQVLRWEEDKEQQKRALQGSGLCVRARRWLRGQFCSIDCSDSRVFAGEDICFAVCYWFCLPVVS